jgi:hypothetical protein
MNDLVKRLEDDLQTYRRFLHPSTIRNINEAIRALQEKPASGNNSK